MQRNSTPLTWRPKGLSDTLDASGSFNGAMGSLSNLIPDPTTAGLWQCRPAAISKTTFDTFTTPGMVSALKIIGNLAFGMIASGLNPGKDEPFCYDLSAGAFIAVTGITNNNTPSSPSTSGAWEPPTMDLIGALLVVTHPGFTGALGVYFGWFDITNPAAPTWTGGNLTGAITFTTPPSAVKQFNGRAYYIQNSPAQPSVVFSDALAATTVTNANQSLTFGDNEELTAFGALPLKNQLGGIIQALLVFKGVSNMYQITGDSATSDLVVNALNVATGTLAPLSICSTPKGVAFVSPDGVRIIDQQATVSDPIGIDGQGVTVPFIFSNVPSRMAAACNGTVLRVTTQNNDAAGSPFQEYWFDLARKLWSGPHTFPAAQIQTWKGTFIMAYSATAALFQSDVVQSVTSTYVENGTQLTWTAATPGLPSTDQITLNAMTEATWDMALTSAIPAISINALTPQSTVIDTVSVQAAGGATLWGAFTWGAALWQGANNDLAPRQLQWTQPIVFNRLSISATGQSASGIKIGTLRMRYQMLRMESNTAAVA